MKVEIAPSCQACPLRPLFDSYISGYQQAEVTVQKIDEIKLLKEGIARCSGFESKLPLSLDNIEGSCKMELNSPIAKGTKRGPNGKKFVEKACFSPPPKVIQHRIRSVNSENNTPILSDYL